MINIFKVQTEIYKNLSDYLTSNSQYGPYVRRRVIDNQLPLVVVEEAINKQNNRSTNYKTFDRLLNYNINVFAKDQNNIPSQLICEELSLLVSDVMENYYHANGGVVSKIARYDGDPTSYQINLRYTLKYIPDREKLY